MKTGGTVIVRGCACGRKECLSAVVDIEPANGLPLQMMMPAMAVSGEVRGCNLDTMLGMWLDLTARRSDWDWRGPEGEMSAGVREIFHWHGMRSEEIRVTDAARNIAAAHNREEDLLPPTLARVTGNNDKAEIDWPEVIRRAGTDEMGSGAAKVFLAAFQQGVEAGKRDGSDASPEGVPPGSIPVVVYL